MFGIDALIPDLRARRVILFVGAGVSRGLGLPSWSQLLDEIALQLNFHPRVFEQHGDFLELAEYYKIQKKSLGGLRSWMDREWHKDEAKVDSSRIHNAIINLRVPLIYTTNYDRWLEIAFARRSVSAAKIANVGNIADVKDGQTQIVKFHGDFDDDNSLVLTEASYFERLSFESPLDIKLRSDSLGKAILFVGYGLKDINVRYLMYKLQRLWSGSEYVDARPQSFMFLTRPNPVQEVILESRGITPIVSQLDDPTSGLAEFLEYLVHEAYGSIP